jgi:hypothetical protein
MKSWLVRAYGGWELVVENKRGNEMVLRKKAWMGFPQNLKQTPQTFNHVSATNGHFEPSVSPLVISDRK